jgi:uncharacterized membrane protein
MRSRSFATWLIVILAVSPLIYLAIIWNSLPDIVPVHFNLNFKPDKMGSKDNTVLLTGILSGVSILVYLLLSNLRRFDPKQRNLPPSSAFIRIAIVVAVFLTLLNFLILIAVKEKVEVMGRLLFPLLGLMIAFLGNYMVNIKPNYFAGFRLPWTLSSNNNWRKTHQFGGKLWFWGGLVTAVTCLFIPGSAIIFFIMMAVIIIIPVVYSYRVFKQEH